MDREVKAPDPPAVLVLEAAAERGAAETKTAHADPPFDIKHIHKLLGTFLGVTKSAVLQKIRINEHENCHDFRMAADELYYCLFTENAAVDGTGQAAAILWELYITDSPPVLSAIVNTYCTGSPSDDADLVADLETALRLQRELSEALDCLELPEEDEMEGEEPEEDEEDELEEVETVNRGGAPVTAYRLWHPLLMDMF